MAENLLGGESAWWRIHMVENPLGSQSATNLLLVLITTLHNRNGQSKNNLQDLRLLKRLSRRLVSVIELEPQDLLASNRDTLAGALVSESCDRHFCRCPTV